MSGIKHMAAAVLHHQSVDQIKETVAREKHFIAQYAEPDHKPLAPEEIHQHPRNHELGGSSSRLSVDDFILVKTLGTGTFARVWLVKVRNPAPEDADKVFALKVLRKVEGKCEDWGEGEEGANESSYQVEAGGSC